MPGAEASGSAFQHIKVGQVLRPTDLQACFELTHLARSPSFPRGELRLAAALSERI